MPLEVRGDLQDVLVMDLTPTAHTHGNPGLLYQWKRAEDIQNGTATLARTSHRLEITEALVITSLSLFQARERQTDRQKASKLNREAEKRQQSFSTNYRLCKLSDRKEILQNQLGGAMAKTKVEKYRAGSY